MSSLSRVSRFLRHSNSIRLIQTSSFVAQANTATQQEENSRFDEATLRKRILEDALKSVPKLGFSLGN